MTRITRKQLETAVDTLNEMTGSPLEPYSKVGDKWVANVGNYHISGAYGGFSLHRMVNDGGGVKDIFYCGHVPARELFGLIRAYRYGIHMGLENASKLVREQVEA